MAQNLQNGLALDLIDASYEGDAPQDGIVTLTAALIFVIG